MRVMPGIIFAAGLVALGYSQVVPQKGDWPEYGRDPGGSRYSPLTQINARNVDHLDRAWTYHTGETGRSFEATPILVNNVLYFPTQNQNIVALNPETGKEVWRYDIQAKTGLRESRGVAYWPGDNQTPARILFGTGDGRLIAVDAKTGQAATGFGDKGTVDLRVGMMSVEYAKAQFGISSPPVIYHDVVIVGAVVQESPSKGASGDPRGFDVRTGKLLWRFHTIPQPGEPNSETWTDEARKDRSGTNAWGIITLDTQTGTVFLPIGSSTYDYYGGDRPGNDLYASSVIALDALTGKMRWYYQVTHHDIYDYDMSAPPVLINVKRGGETIPALAQITKQGLLFILDRRSGKPIFGVEERPIPKGDVPGEWYSPTEPFPVKPVPLARTSVTKDELMKRTPESEKFCSDWFSKLRQEGPFTPFGLTPSLLMPGSMGGGDWGGVSFDPNLGYIFVNANNLGGVGHIVPWPNGPLPYRNEGGAIRFIDQSGYPCSATPWAQLTAVDANTGDIVWQKPVGSYDELEAQGLKDTGAPGEGGSIVTAGGLVFIAMTSDSKFRAFDAHTGKELWVTKLEASGTTVPMTYMGTDGKQYVVVAAGGTNRFGMIAGTAGHNPDTLAAFALSDKPKSAPTVLGSQPASAAPSIPTSTPADAASSLPDGDGKAEVMATCTKCHGTANFTSIRMNRQGWEDEVQNMRDRGAVGSDEDFKKIIDYLSKTFPRQ
jgi:glucose dehydrogenase